MSGSLSGSAPAPRGGASLLQRAVIAAVVALLAQSAACAAGPLAPDTRTTMLSTRFAGGDADRAQRLAPDLYARAERAAQDARDSRDAAERGDHATRADLLLKAAIAEADRVEAERSAAAADARAERDAEQRAALERERQEVEQTEQRDLAARVARSDAARVFRAIGATTADKSPNRTDRERDASWLIGRATLTLAAAIALGLAAQRADAIEHAIAQLSRAATGKAQSAATRVAAAERVLADAERALGQARKQRPGPTPQEIAALVISASERGLNNVKAMPRGVVIGLDIAFTPGSTAPTVLGVRLLAGLAALARAYPHGAIQLETRADEAASSPADRSAHARLERVRAALIGDAEPARIERTTAPADEPGGDQVRVVFAAYVPSTTKMP